MHDQIASNMRKTWLLLVLFCAIIVAIGFAFYYLTDVGYFAIPLAAVIAVACSVGAYYNSDKIVLAVSRARRAPWKEFPHYINCVEGLAIAAGIPKPRAYVIDDSAPNAFATGRDPTRAVVCVTTGLLEKLDRAELEGVISHELAHIRNRDILIACLAAVMAGTVVLLSDWLLRSMWYGGRRRRRGSGRGGGGGAGILAIVGLVLAILAPLAAALMQSLISQRREYLADAEGARLTRYPEGLASALKKLSQDQEPLEVANKATAHLYIVSPFKGRRLRMSKLFGTHPPIEERIRRLQQM